MGPQACEDDYLALFLLTTMPGLTYEEHAVLFNTDCNPSKGAKAASQSLAAICANTWCQSIYSVRHIDGRCVFSQQLVCFV